MTPFAWLLNLLTGAVLITVAVLFGQTTLWFWAPVVIFTATHVALFSNKKIAHPLGLANTMLSTLVLGGAALVLSNYSGIRDRLYEAQVDALHDDLAAAEARLNALQENLQATVATPLSDNQAQAGLECQFQLRFSRVQQGQEFGLLELGTDPQSAVSKDCKLALAVVDASLLATAEVKSLRGKVEQADARVTELENSPDPQPLPDLPERLTDWLLLALPILALVSAGVAVANKSHEEA